MAVRRITELPSTKEIPMDENTPATYAVLELAFYNWLLDYETCLTERWSHLAPDEWRLLIAAQWAAFRGEVAKAIEFKAKNGQEQNEG